MTGEITLHGDVLPIGGLKEKSMAAYREGIKQVIIPKDNFCDLYDVDQEVKDHIEFVPVATLEEAFAVSMAPVSGRKSSPVVAGDDGKQRQPRTPRAKTGAKRTRPVPEKTPKTVGREIPQ